MRVACCINGALQSNSCHLPVQSQQPRHRRALPLQGRRPGRQTTRRPARGAGGLHGPRTRRALTPATLGRAGAAVRDAAEAGPGVRPLRRGAPAAQRVGDAVGQAHAILRWACYEASTATARRRRVLWTRMRYCCRRRTTTSRAAIYSETVRRFMVWHRVAVVSRRCGRRPECSYQWWDSWSFNLAAAATCVAERPPAGPSQIPPPSTCGGTAQRGHSPRRRLRRRTQQPRAANGDSSGARMLANFREHPCA